MAPKKVAVKVEPGTEATAASSDAPSAAGKAKRAVKKDTPRWTLHSRVPSSVYQIVDKRMSDRLRGAFNIPSSREMDHATQYIGQMAVRMLLRGAFEKFSEPPPKTVIVQLNVGDF